MRQVALATLMAQVGCFVPARRARIGLADRIFTRVGASDNLARGQSTFMVEMTETADHPPPRHPPFSLVVLDEIGRGTSTFDGLSHRLGGGGAPARPDRRADAVRHALPRAAGARRASGPG